MSDQSEDNTFANKTFFFIDERFALNATSMLDQTNKEFAASQINVDLLSYQKDPRVMPSTLRQLLMPWRQFLQAVLNQKELLVW